MKTVIYLDELLLVNFLIAAFLLPGSGLLCGNYSTPRRIVAGSAVAAVTSLILLVPQLPFVVQLVLKTIGVIICVLIGFGRRQLRVFLRLCAWYLLLNLTLAGVVSGLILTRRGIGLQTNNLVVYLDISPLLLLGCVLGVYVFLRALLWCFERPNPGQSNLLQMDFGGYELSMQAFCDTGFSMQKSNDGRAGVMVSFDGVKQQLPDLLCSFLEEFFCQEANQSLSTPCLQWKMRFVCCTTAAGPGLFPAILSDRVVLTYEDKVYMDKALVMFCQQSFPYGCAAAYSPDFLEGAKPIQLQQRGRAE